MRHCLQRPRDRCRVGTQHDRLVWKIRLMDMFQRDHCVASRWCPPLMFFDDSCELHFNGSGTSVPEVQRHLPISGFTLRCCPAATAACIDNDAVCVMCVMMRCVFREYCGVVPTSDTHPLAQHVSMCLSHRVAKTYTVTMRSNEHLLRHSWMDHLCCHSFLSRAPWFSNFGLRVLSVDLKCVIVCRHVN